MTTSTGATPISFALVGAGRVGTSVALLLQEAGNRVVGVSSRTSESANAAAARLDCETFDHRSVVPGCDLVMIGAVDSAVRQVDGEIAPHIAPGTAVCHFAGALGTTALPSVTAAGGVPIALHPVQSCPTIDAAVRRLPGSAWGVTCEAGHFEWAARLIRDDLKGVPIAVSEDSRAAWHAAASTVSNGIAALMAGGEFILESVGIEKPAEVLGPLAAGTVANAVDAGGGIPALTGPVVRGESQTLKRHLDGLKGRPDLMEAYRTAAAVVVRVAELAGRISPATRESLLSSLEPR